MATCPATGRYWPTTRELRAAKDALYVRKHIREHHTNCEKTSCFVCELTVCVVCGAYEGGLASECPGVKLTTQQTEDIYVGKIDFIGGKWVTPGCSPMLRQIQVQVHL